MNSRSTWVSIAAAALLTVASVCLAQEATPPPATPAPAAPAAPAFKGGGVPGNGSIGGMIGGSYFYSAEDYSAGAQPRFSFMGSFRYMMSEHLRWQVSPGFTWASYTNTEKAPFADPSYPGDATKDRYLTLVLPVTAQLQLVSRPGAWRYHVGAGPGAYRVWIENRRKVLKDPVSLRLHRGIYWGFTAEAGVERFIKAMPSVSLELSAADHHVFAKRDDQFPSGFNSSIGAFEVRFGANYHFALNKPKKGPENPANTPPPAR